MLLRNLLNKNIAFGCGLRPASLPLRFFSVQTASKTGIDKLLLKQLRDKTGFPFTKCNEALKLYDNNVTDAEKWLNKQAEKEGWKKAQKLQGRSTDQGLVGVLVRENFAAVVELACETDFVARNEMFQQLVAATAETTVNFRKNVILQNQKINSFENGDISHLREVLMVYELECLKVNNSDSTLQELIVGTVGKIGENIKLKRAISIATSFDNIIGTEVHGNNSSSSKDCLMGNFAAVVVLKPLKSGLEKKNLIKLAKNISQHVIGMNPTGIECSDKVSKEDALLTQEYLLNDKLTVGELLSQSNVACIDFVRYGINE